MPVLCDAPLPAPARTSAGFREYGEADVALVRLIGRARRLGFSMEDIAELVAVSRGGPANANLKSAIERRIAAIDAKIAALKAMAASLTALAEGDDPEGHLGAPVAADGQESGASCFDRGAAGRAAARDIRVGPRGPR